MCLVNHCRGEEALRALCAWLIIAEVRKHWEHCVPGAGVIIAGVKKYWEHCVPG